MTGVALIDYGAGNLRSVENALRAAGASDIAVTADPALVAKSDRIVLPGVGAFAHCMSSLAAIDGLIEAVTWTALEKGRPFLGICVGMQLMAEWGSEHREDGKLGPVEGLGWVAGYVNPIKPDAGVRVPHMGWNVVKPVNQSSLIEPGEAYFCHSYAYECGQWPSAVRAVTDHGGEIVAAIQTGNALGVQFHPEKSQAYGIATLQRFLKWRP